MASASLPSSPPPPSPPSISASHSESTVALATSLVPQMPQNASVILKSLKVGQEHHLCKLCYSCIDALGR
ncbi:hypothetical protein V6N12_000734 [Hibiscus sabdariffa]|uniref:Uncharacterized protein n=1 Tax=Hibiscus sabdariffa TaxID=183260 RepID=A0ABR2BYN1_9ROSI